MSKRYPNDAGHKIVIQLAERMIQQNNKLIEAHKRRIEGHEKSISVLQKLNDDELSKKIKSEEAMLESDA